MPHEPLLSQADLISRCFLNSFLPTSETAVEDPPLSTGVPVYREFFQTFVGVVSAAQNFDGNGVYVRGQPGGGAFPVTTSELESQGPLRGNATRLPLGTRPAYPGKTPPPLRTDATCADADAARRERREDRGRAVRRAFVRHRRDLLAVVVMAALGLTVLGYILLQAAGLPGSGLARLEQQGPLHLQGRVLLGAGDRRRSGTDGQHRRRTGRRREVDRARERPRGAGVRDRAPLRADLPRRDAAAAPAHAAQGHVPRAGAGHARTSGALPEGGRLPVAQTLPDVNYDEILGNLDADTRSYLKLLLAGASEGLGDEAGDGSPDPAAVDDLRGTYKRFEPLARDARELYAGLARRRKSLRRAVSAFEQIAVELGRVDRDLAGLVDRSRHHLPGRRRAGREPAREPRRVARRAAADGDSTRQA